VDIAHLTAFMGVFSAPAGFRKEANRDYGTRDEEQRGEKK